MIAAGIDLGGTKIEAQLFDVMWNCKQKIRLVTPKTYESLLSTLHEAVQWVSSHQKGLPIGIGAAGIISKKSGQTLTANLPASGERLSLDIKDLSQRSFTYLNDSRAFTLSEAVFGSAIGYDLVAGLTLGTGTGGGLVSGGRLLSDPAGIGGEFGHISAPAHLVNFYDLPTFNCGCGRKGCFETLVSGPGMERIAEVVTGHKISPLDIDKNRTTDAGLEQVWKIWCDIVAELCLTIDYIVNPDVIVIGGGLSNMRKITSSIKESMEKAQLKGFGVPDLILAQDGETSGARGAAYAAWLQARNA